MEKFTWTHLFKGLLGSVVGGAIDGVGLGVTAAVRTIPVSAKVMVAMWKAKTLGPILKGTLTPGVVIAGALAPAAICLGGMIYGIGHHFVGGATDLTKVPRKAIDDVRRFNGEPLDTMLSEMAEWSAKTPKSPDDIFEIRVIEALRGLISGSLTCVITGLAVPVITIIHTPAIYFRATRSVWSERDFPIPLALGIQVLGTAALGMLIALSPILATLGGLGIGVARGYTKGIYEAISKAVGDCESFNSFMKDVAYKA